MLDLAVVIVSWNTRALVLDALRTLYADLESSRLNAGAWVVDNASSDGTPDAVRAAFPAVNLLTSAANLGFGAGNNLALRALGFSDQPTPNPDGPRAVFLLNSDTLVQPGAVRALYDALFSLPRAGLVGARLSYEDGAFQHSAFRFPGLLQIVIDLYPLPGWLRGRLYETRLNGRYPRSRYAGRTPFPVDHTLGATMMLRREAIEQTGLFDEQFFMSAEEVDWSLRIRRAGWQIYTVPAAHVIHLEGRSTRQIRPESVVNLWRSRFRLYDKHYSPLKRALARGLVKVGMRLQIGRAQNAALVEAYRKVIRL
jgi:N-acetylglucosaminyl-diphospho-decaprenol L-rhamnosyltransferase